MDGLTGTLASEPRPHAVQFYDTEDTLIDEVSGFIGAGLAGGEAGVVIATESHRHELLRRLPSKWSATDVGDSCVLLDADETLQSFMVDGWPDAERFERVIGSTLERASRAGNDRVRAFGEMVALLVQRGNTEAALHLEHLWNDLAQRHRFSLLCAYPLNLFARSEDGAAFHRVCAAHSHVHEHVVHDAEPGTDFNRRVAELRQKAASLQTEIARREQTERRLRQRERELETKVAELALADQRKDEFLALLGHELRNPLAPIANALHIMRRVPLDETGPLPQLRDIIDRQVTLMTRLVDDLLDVARISRGKLQLQLGEHRIGDTLERALELVRGLANERRHALSVDIAEPQLLVHGDQARIGQAVSNLLHNAIKYTPSGGRIELRAVRVGDALHIIVSDNGIGLDAELLAHIFEPFIQGENSVCRSSGGLGVGLTLVRSIALLHGGRAEAHSDGIGQGSRFTLVLPLTGL